MKYSASDHTAWDLADEIEKLYVSGSTIAEIASACGTTPHTVNKVLSARGLIVPVEIRRRVREMLLAGMPEDNITAETGVVPGVVKAIAGRLRRTGDRRLSRSEEILRLAKAGYSRKRIREKTGKQAVAIQAALQETDLYADQIHSIAGMYDGGLTVEAIALELGIRESRVKGMLREAGRISGPDRVPIGFQIPKCYPNRRGKRSMVFTSDMADAMEILLHGISLVKAADAEALTDRRHELHGETVSYIDTHGSGPLCDGRTLSASLEEAGLPHFPWRCDYERNLHVFEHSRKAYEERIDPILTLASRWCSVSEKYLKKVDTLYSTEYFSKI